MGELGKAESLAQVPAELKDELDKKEARWNERGDPWSAIEFLTMAMMALEPKRAIKAAAYLVETDQRPAMVEVARRVLAGNGDTSASEDQLSLYPEPRGDIALLKKRLGLDPRNSMAWSDIALAYSSIGQHRKATSAMEIALRLAPDSRFLLRSAARLFVHQADPERAHRLLVGPARISHDPWIMASEIAVATVAGRNPRSIRSVRDAIEGGRFSARSLAEAASALATIELGSGNSSKARRLFVTALRDPNENSLAQAEWASTHLTGLDLSVQLAKAPGAYEARARASYEASHWTAAVSQAWGWLLDQPFSVEPAAFGSFIAEMGLGDYQLGVEFADRGLTANPNSWTLLNNLAYALLELGEVAKAEAVLHRVHPPPLTDQSGVTWRATEGLLAFRKGDAASGRFLYEQAIAAARALRLEERAAMAAIMLAREEWRANGVIAIPIVRMAVTAARGVSNPLLFLVADGLEREVRAVPDTIG